ncbi:MAG: sigma-54-dependent Fis family transcriptional regulator [Desulfatiglandaceae bacterium]
MPWQSKQKYECLLNINNAIITKKTREGLFEAIATQLREVCLYDRCSIQLYDPMDSSITYFATAKGIKPNGITCETSRPLSAGAVANTVIESGKPVIIQDLTSVSHWTSADSMLMAGLTSTMAFPLIIRDRIIGSLHCSFKECPENIMELAGFMEQLCKQISIAIDNMLSYEKLRNVNEALEKQKGFVLEKINKANEAFYFTSHKMTKLKNDMDLVAESNAPVLIVGETGTGKDLVARYIHNHSPRSQNLFVKVNCASLASSLIESEFFGHARGSFTGANFKRIGRFEMANGGTIFLDEIGELPMQSQAKLLQVLEDKAFERVGESTPISVDFRIISATNQNLAKNIRAGKFRRDLFYRINTILLEIPPLRERLEDIELLVRCFTSNFAKVMQRPEAQYSSSAMDALLQYQWPGNVRELQNAVEKIMILSNGQKLTKMDIKRLLHPFDFEETQAQESHFLTRDEMEKRHIEEALERCGGRTGGKRGAAQLLGIPRSTLQYRMKKLEISPVSGNS